MIDSSVATLIVGGAGMLTTALAWLWGDAKSKARAQFMEEKLKLLNEKYDSMEKNYSDRLNSLEQNLVKTEQIGKEVNSYLQRLDDSKASKEIVGTFKDDIQIIRADIDRRFDKLERMIENIRK